MADLQWRREVNGVHIRVFMYIRTYIYVHVEFSGGITSAFVFACVGSRALAGCCVYTSAAKDASITQTHLECRRVFCSRTFRMYYIRLNCCVGDC